MSAQAAQLITHRTQFSKKSMNIELLYCYQNAKQNKRPAIIRNKRVRHSMHKNNQSASTVASFSPLAVLLGGF